MGWPLALAILVAGLLLGQLWARRSRRLWSFGTARPGVAFAALAALAGALITGVRGLWPEALALAVLSLGLAAVARTRLFGRGAAQRAERPAVRPTVRLSREEAAALLGVAPDASPAAVQAAYRRLIRLAHPDQGGTAGLATQLNAARDAMLKP